MSCLESLVHNADCLCWEQQTWYNSRTARPYQNRVTAHSDQSGRKIADKGPTWTSKAGPTNSNPHIVFPLPKSPFKVSSQITLTIPIVTDHWETNVIPSKRNYSC